MSYKVIIIISILIFCIHTGNTQSLKETIEIALESNPSIASGKSQLKESELDAKSTSRSTLPQLDFDASYRHVTERTELEFPAASPLSGMNINLGVYDTYESGLTANYILFSGFAQKNLIKLKNHTVDLNNQQLKKTKKTIALNVIAQYRQVQNYKLEVEALNAAKKRVDLQLKRIKALVNQGMALSLDTLSLTLSKLNNNQKIIAAEANLGTARQELASLVGKDITVDMNILIDTDKKLSEFDAGSNNDLKMLNIRKAMIQSNRAITQSGYYPKIGLFAGIKYGKPGIDMIENDWMTYGVWGVNMSWNLFKWGADYLKVQSHKASVNSIGYQYKAASDKVKLKFDAAVREYHAKRKQLKVMVIARNLAKNKMQIIESRYRQGMSTVTEFNDANLELTDAEINLQRQKILLALKISEIDFLSGKSINQWSIEQ